MYERVSAAFLLLYGRPAGGMTRVAMGVGVPEVWGGVVGVVAVYAGLARGE